MSVSGKETLKGASGREARWLCGSLQARGSWPAKNLKLPKLNRQAVASPRCPDSGLRGRLVRGLFCFGSHPEQLALSIMSPLYPEQPT